MRITPYGLRYHLPVTLTYNTAGQRTGVVNEEWFNSEGGSLRRLLNGERVEEIQRGSRSRTYIDRIGGETVVDYDEWDNEIKRTFPDGSIQRSEYDPVYSNRTRYINENGIATENEYNISGALIRKTEAKGTPAERITEYAYDASQNRVRITRLGDAVTAETTVRYEYDNVGNITKRIDAENNTTEFTAHDN